MTTSKIYIKGYFGNWHEASIEEAAEFVGNMFDRMLAASAADRMDIINSKHLKGATFEELCSERLDIAIEQAAAAVADADARIARFIAASKDTYDSARYERLYTRQHKAERAHRNLVKRRKAAGTLQRCNHFKAALADLCGYKLPA